MLLGLIFGSFFNVVVSRPDWYKGRSRCDNCHHTLAWYDLIPIVSYVSLRGKCRYCKSKIKPTHLFSEIMCMCAGGCLMAVCSDMKPLEIACLILTVVILAFNSVSDINTQSVYMIPIYIATLIVGGIKIYSAFASDMTFGIVYTSIFALFTLCCICLEKPAKNFIGAGDLEIYPLLFLTSPYFGAILLLSSLFLYIKKAILSLASSNVSVSEPEVEKAAVSDETTEKKSTLNKRIPFFPIMFLGYLLFLFIGKFFGI